MGGYFETYHVCWCLKQFLVWATSRQNQQSGMCGQQRLRSAWASTQSDQSPYCLHEESLGPPIESTAKTLIRQGGCAGWSESSLGAKSFCWFCHEAAQLWSWRSIIPILSSNHFFRLFNFQMITRHNFMLHLIFLVACKMNSKMAWQFLTKYRILRIKIN